MSGRRGGGSRGGQYDNRGGGGGYRGGTGRGRGERGGSYGSNSAGGRGGGDSGYYGRGGGRGGAGAGDRDRGGGRGRGGPRRGPDPSKVKEVLTNLIPCTTIDNFSFVQYSMDFTDQQGNHIDSRFRRFQLFEKGLNDLLEGMPDEKKKDLKRLTFFIGQSFYSVHAIAGLEQDKLPLELVSSLAGDSMRCVSASHFTIPSELSGATLKVVRPPLGQLTSNVEQYRCSNCSSVFPGWPSVLQHCRTLGHSPVFHTGESAEPAPQEVFVAYANTVLQAAMKERLAPWGKDFIDPRSGVVPKDRRDNPLDITVFKAFSCTFGLQHLLVNGKGINRLVLTVDLKAKVIRNKSLLLNLYPKGLSSNLTKQEQARATREWVGQVVIYKNEKKCYCVSDLDWSKTPSTFKIPGKSISHAAYFAQKKIVLKHPDKPPMVAVPGRRNEIIYLPAELVMGNELDPRVREQLPMIASFKPDERNQAIDTIKNFLIPGAQTTKGAAGLLPATGIILEHTRLSVAAQVLQTPQLMVANIPLPPGCGDNWGPKLSKANYNIQPKNATIMNVVLIHNHMISPRGAGEVYGRIQNMVNSLNATYRFSPKPYALVEAGDNESHWNKVEQFFQQKSLPSNIFVLDFVKPNYGALDKTYPVVKQILTKFGYLSQFVNFKTYSHDNPADMRKSNMILEGVSRQVLQKAGVRIWWASIPPSLPLPVVFVGVDVFHAPMVYDPKTKKRGRKSSCAAIIVEVIRRPDQAMVEMYSRTYKREGGQEYQLGEPLRQTLEKALHVLKVNPASAIVWRDGIDDGAFEEYAKNEIQGIRAGLIGAAVGMQSSAPPVPLSYIVCQKRIPNKFFTTGLGQGTTDGEFGAPSGTLVKDIQGLAPNTFTFYLNGRAPPFSTPKPVRYVCMARDNQLSKVPIAVLTWEQTHTYPNWPGPIKVPAVCQMAHKLAELGGSMSDGGQSIAHDKFKNKVHFL